MKKQLDPSYNPLSNILDPPILQTTSLLHHVASFLDKICSALSQVDNYCDNEDRFSNLLGHFTECGISMRQYAYIRISSVH